jgi:N-acetylneuraminic acid mutarotase
MRKLCSFVLILILCFSISSPSLVSAAGDYWTTLMPMQQARAALGVVAVNSKIYAIGGSTTSGSYPPDIFAGGFVGTNEEYEIEMDMWSYRASMLTPRAHFAIAAYKNKIYCIGGAIGFRVDERTGFNSYIPSGVNEVYDTVTNTWETKKPLPYPQMNLKAQEANGKIYVVGGAYTYVYDPEDDSWALKEQAPVSHPWPVVLDDRLIVSGEYSQLWGSAEQKILFYDTETDSWSEGKSSSIAVVQGAAGATTGMKAPQKVYVLGLIVETSFKTFINQVYDLQTDTWATASAMHTNRSDFGVAIVNDILYAIGGYLRSSSHVIPVDVSEQYTPVEYIPEFPSWVTFPLIIALALTVVFVRRKLRKRELL